MPFGHHNDTHPLLPSSTPPTSSSSPSPCRPTCYKLTIVIVLVFLLMQYAANFIAYRHKYSQMFLSNWHHSGDPNPDPSSLSADLRWQPTSFKLSSAKHKLNVINVNSSSLVDVMNASTTTSSRELCPLIPPKLVGQLKVLTEAPDSMEQLEALFPDLEPGGRYRPKECLARHRVAIIIPYRDREEHLRVFLYNMHPILQRQQLDYGIYIVEEAGRGKFNRAKLMNIGFVESLKQYDYQCFIFHDVDLIPEDDRNLYTCPEQPRHMSVAIDKFGYRLPYVDLFGGVSALTKKQFEKINGFSNEFWGWGGEDDDMSNRIRFHGFKISRYPPSIARYKMLKHKGDTPNPERYKKLYSGKRRFKTDGINSLKYKRVDLLFKKLYTWVLVDVLG